MPRNYLRLNQRPRSDAACHKLGAGGAEGSRTPDLLIANETLYQLSYDPAPERQNDTFFRRDCKRGFRDWVDMGGAAFLRFAP